MHRSLFGFTAAAILCVSATPALAQYVPLEDASDPISLEQRQTVAGIRQRDRNDYVFAARKAGILSRKRFSDGTHAIKPLAEWTQADFERFKHQYQRATPEGLWGTAQAQVFFERVTKENSRDDDD